jgi:hypothetical protein
MPGPAPFIKPEINLPRGKPGAAKDRKPEEPPVVRPQDEKDREPAPPLVNPSGGGGVAR